MNGKFIKNLMFNFLFKLFYLSLRKNYKRRQIKNVMHNKIREFGVLVISLLPHMVVQSVKRKTQVKSRNSGTNLR